MMRIVNMTPTAMRNFGSALLVLFVVLATFVMLAVFPTTALASDAEETKTVDSVVSVPLEEPEASGAKETANIDAVPSVGNETAALEKTEDNLQVDKDVVSKQQSTQETVQQPAQESAVDKTKQDVTSSPVVLNETSAETASKELNEASQTVAENTVDQQADQQVDSQSESDTPDKGTAGSDQSGADKSTETPVDTPSSEQTETPLVVTSASISTASTSALAEGTYYFTAVNPVFSEYYVLDSGNNYLSMTKEASSLGEPQQWAVTYDHDDANGAKLCRIQSASGYYLIASTTGIASITKTASTDAGAYWYTVISTIDGQSVAAFYNGNIVNNVYRALALVRAYGSDGKTVTMTVESLACGSKTYPDVPDYDWLWYYTSASQKDWAIEYYDKEGATGSTAKTQVAGGAAAYIAENGFSLPGYSFVNWIDDDGTSYAAGSSYTYKNFQDGFVKKLYAQWKQNTATVTYSAGSGGAIGLGTGSANATTISETVGAKSGVLAGTTSSTFSGVNASASTGHHFSGWTVSNGNGLSGAEYSSTTLTPATVVKLTKYADGNEGTETYHGLLVTANFEANTYTVNYDANGGSGALTASSVTYGSSSLSSSSALSRTGYTFSGWNTKADGTGVSVSDSAAASTLVSTGAVSDTDGASTTLYAQWKSTSTTPAVITDPVVPDVIVDPVVPSTEEEDDDNKGSSTTNPTTDVITNPTVPASIKTLDVVAATTEVLTTVGGNLIDAASSSGESQSLADAISNLTPAEAAAATGTAVTAVAAVSTVAGLVGAGASVAGAIAGAGAAGAGAAGIAGAAGATGAADLAAELAAESALTGGFFGRLRRRIKGTLGMDDAGDDVAEDE